METANDIQEALNELLLGTLKSIADMSDHLGFENLSM